MQKGRSEQELKEFKHIFDELRLSSQCFILKGRQLVIPESLQKLVTELAHEGHQGNGKTKRLLRSRVWYSGIDKAVDDMCENCAMNRKKSD